MSEAEPALGIWGLLAGKIEAHPVEEDGGGLWERLSVQVDPAEFRPKVAPDIEVKEFKLRWGNDYAMIANPRDLLFYRLEPGEVELLPLMDGTRTVKEIVVERFQSSGDLEMSGVSDLVRQLNVGGFLDRPFLDVDEAVKRAMDPVSNSRRKAREFAKTLSIDWKNADALVRWSYTHGLKWFFNRWVAAVSSLVALGGFVAFLSVQGRFSLSGESAAIESLALLGMSYLLTFIHELAHAVVLTRYDRRVKSAGFMIYFGSPAFFVDASDGLLMSRWQRITQSAAGPFSELIVAGLASLALWAFPDSSGAGLLYKFALLNYFYIFLNLIPLLELDGYWILSDLIQVPDLRPRSLSFLRDDLGRKISKRERFTKQEVGLALYGIVGFAFTILSFYTAFFFWQEIFGSLVRKLWDGGLITQILLVALGLFLAGPVLRAGINLLRSVGRRVRAVWSRVRFRLETKWRVEAASLIDGLPVFDDLPEDVLSDLAGRVRLRTFARGKPVVRQGERPEAFYVVRRGTLQVVEEDPESGNERALRALGRGESFGELGLVEASPRTATVRALEDAELFEIDKGTFDRLLADMIHVPDFAPTLQAAAELRELSCFATLDPNELSQVLEHGEWVNLAPGEVVFEQGDVGDSFFAVRSGQVDVVEDGELVRTMGPGSYFGEIALLRDVPRTATVAARTPVRAFRLDREGFDRLVSGAFRHGTLKPATGADRTWQH
ncbi:MAG: cyclic nucleotide-binding domain-containing protein [Actinomycetota bacterium]